ncbi:neutral/alkaline non-lysosomal ceramidase N-terminal domain-containing protein [Membranihabitans maritimus]|uniref:neutral/alkaline non-lysosomal ceramidase N-terminal domain-containing protein n=1 Tax=Membranihabitans maritimus TaxID=2904244 RepID=UPI001F26C515|nr:neutral/alkaline non-lysosomal ceramidase N-terminal domain-containing protein [Membranihabitans maritimus]
MRKLFGAVIQILFCTVTLISSPFEDAGIWKAGIAKIDITPQTSMWMAGYAARTGPSEGTLHSIWAKALVLEDENGNKGVLITTDLASIQKELSDTIRNQLQSRFGFEKAQIIINTSHTHSAPLAIGDLVNIYPLDESGLKKVEEYSQFLVRAIINLVEKALNDREPCKVFSANGQARFQVNRRNNGESTLNNQRSLNGPNEYSVPVLKVETLKGHLKGIVFGYACHATVLGINFWSGDYPGFAQIELEADHPGTIAMFFQGAGGDQNPLPRRSVPLARQYGRTLAAAVDRVIEEAMIELAPSLETAYREIDLRLNAPPSWQDLKEHCGMAKGYQLKWGQKMINKLENKDPLPESYPYPIQVWKIGSQSIFGLGGEPVIDYAITIKNIFGHDVFVMGYNNDVMAYIPSARILHEGGYEGATSQFAFGQPSTWAFDIENSIVSNIVELAKTLSIQTPPNPLLDN